MKMRERVAKAIYEATYPGWRWEGLAPALLEEWGRVADAAIAAMGTPPESAGSGLRSPMDPLAATASLDQRNAARGIQR